MRKQRPHQKSGERERKFTIRTNLEVTREQILEELKKNGISIGDKLRLLLRIPSRTLRVSFGSEKKIGFCDILSVMPEEKHEYDPSEQKTTPNWIQKWYLGLVKEPDGRTTLVFVDVGKKVFIKGNINNEEALLEAIEKSEGHQSRDL